MNNLRIVVADDHGVVRAGLQALLSAEEGFEVVGEATTGKQAVELVEQLRPDVVVMDIRMPDLNGVDATKQALAVHPKLKVVGLSADADNQLAVELMRAGAVGFVRKDAAYEELVTAIRAGVGGTVYCSSQVLAQLIRTDRRAGSVFELLSDRERQHLQLIAEGKSTKEIAAALDISVKTVETHRRNVLQKLNVESVAELTKYAVREGITPL